MQVQVATKLRGSLKGEAYCLAPGDITDVDSETATSWIRSGAANPVASGSPKVKRKVSNEPTEDSGTSG